MKKNSFTIPKVVMAVALFGFMAQAQAASVDLIANNTIQNTGTGTYTWQNSTAAWGGYTNTNTTNTNTGTSGFGNTAVTTTSGAPALVPSGTGAAWISTNADFNTGNVLSSYYSYRTTFSLAGLDLSSVNIQGAWASDNRGRAIFVNGIEIPVAAYGFNGAPTGVDGLNDRNQGAGTNPLSTFSILGTQNALNAGLNTIDFVFYNGSIGNAAGLIVKFSSASADSAIPEPEILVLMGIGALAFRFSSSRKA